VTGVCGYKTILDWREDLSEKEIVDTKNNIAL